MRCIARQHDHTRPQTYDQMAFAIRCGISILEPAVAQQLEALGACHDRSASLLLLFDVPYGFALQHIELLERTKQQVLVVTGNMCPEYWDDLWDRGLNGLIVGIDLDRRIAEAMERVALGERLRVTPPRSSTLRPNERAILGAIARGWDNARIGRQLHLEEKTIRNTLTSVYAKLKVANRVEAALYYWGREDLFR